MADVSAYAGSAASSAGSISIKAVLCWSEFYNGKWQDMKTSDVDDPVTLNIPNASGLDRGFELDRNRIRIVVQPFLESVPPDALVLAILPPNDGTSPPIPFSQGFVMHNTHSLPTNTENIQVDLGQLFGALATMPLPVRALTPSVRYLGDQNAGTFSVKRYNSLLSIINNTVDTTQAVLGFPGSPRYVEPQIGPGDATNWPFFYEDKRNQFYVSVQPNFVPCNYLARIWWINRPLAVGVASPAYSAADDDAVPG